MGEESRDVVYAGSSGMEGAGALVKSDAQRAIGEVQASMMLAKMNPRDQVRSLDRIVNSCQRLKLAEAATYAYPRGNTTVTGPSIRLAEAIAQEWGNIRFGVREIEQRSGESTVQAYAWDVETNTLREATFQVRHKRDTKDGGKILTEGRDIYEHVANQAARRLRACILGVIPGDILETALDECKKTLTTKGVATPDQIQKMVKTFETEYKVSRAQIEARIGCRVEAIQPAQYVALRAVYTALRDNFAKVEDYFDVDAGTPATPPSGVAAAKAAAAKISDDRRRNEATTAPASPPAAAAPAAEDPAPRAMPEPTTDEAAQARAEIYRDAMVYLGVEQRKHNNLLRALSKGLCKDIAKIDDIPQNAWDEIRARIDTLMKGAELIADQNITDDQEIQDKWYRWSEGAIMSINNLSMFGDFGKIDGIFASLSAEIEAEKSGTSAG